MKAVLAGLSPEHRDVLGAVALGGSLRTRTWVLGMLAALDAKNAAGKRYTGDDVKRLMHELAKAGWLIEDRLRQGHWQVEPSLFSAVFLGLIDSSDGVALREALAHAMGFKEEFRGARFPDFLAAIAIVRLELFSGVPYEQIERLRTACGWGMDWPTVVHRALFDVLDEALYEGMPVVLQSDELFSKVWELIRAGGGPGLRLVRLGEL